MRSGSPPPRPLSPEALAELVGRRDKDGVKLARQLLKALKKSAPDSLPAIADDAELAAAGADALPALLDEAEAATDESKRAAALAAIARHVPRETLSAEQIGRVRKMLSGAKSGEVATAAGFALAHAGDRDFLSAQLDALVADDADIRRTALFFIGAGRFRPALDKLVELLAPGNASVRSAAIWAAGEIGSQQVVPTLLGMIEQGAAIPDVCEALGKLADVTALPQLLQVVQHGTAEQTSAACGAVARTLAGAEGQAIPKDLATTIASTMDRVAGDPPDGTAGFFALAVLARLGAEISPNRVRAALGAKLDGDDLKGVAGFFAGRKPPTH